MYRENRHSGSGVHQPVRGGDGDRRGVDDHHGERVNTKAHNWKRFFGLGGHWLTWSLPVMTVCGTSVRLHIGFAAWGVVEVCMSMTRGGVGLLPGLAAVYALLGVLIVREALRAFVLSTCDRSGTATDRFAIVWPGAVVIRPCTPKNGFAARHARIRTAVAGLASGGVVVGVMCGLVLLAGGTSELLWFDLLHPATSVGQFGITQGWLFWAWWLYAMSVVAFVADLLPLRPMDGGMLAMEILRRRSDEGEWRPAAMLVGLIAGMAGLAVVTDSARLLGLVGIAGVWSVFEMRAGQQGAEEMGAEVVAEDGLKYEREGRRTGVDALMARLRSEGVMGLSAAEVAELDQIAAELRDRLETGAAHPQDDVPGSQMPIP